MLKARYQAAYKAQKARAEELALKVGELEKTLASSQKVIRCFSHDARSALSVAKSQLELVQMIKEPTDKPGVFSLTAEGVGYIALSEKKIMRVTDMYQQYLDMEKMERGDYVLKPTKFNLIHALREAKEEVGEGVIKKTNKPVKIVYHAVEEDVAEKFASFNGEENLIRTCFANLMDNAYGAAPDHTEVQVTLKSDENTLYVEIENNGVIPEEIRDPKKLFAYGTTSGKAKGNGIGTHTARLFAKVHGGDITFETCDKTNSTVFRVTLPKSQDEEDQIF